MDTETRKEINALSRIKNWHKRGNAGLVKTSPWRQRMKKLSIIRCNLCWIYTRDFYKSRRTECKKCSNSRHKRYTENNREKWNDYIRQWLSEHPGYLGKYAKNKYNTDPLFKRAACIRTVVNQAIHRKDSGAIVKYLGCSNKQFRKYIESQWKSSMSWSNYGLGRGKWNLDHIIPLSSAKNEEELIKLCHYSNIQPLWHEENVRKSNSLPFS